MMKTACNSLTIFILLSSVISYSQQVKNKGTMDIKTNEFWEKIEKANSAFYNDNSQPKKTFLLSYEGIDIPKSVDEFTKVWAGDAESQGATGTCWCFSTTSFFESEIYRINKQKIELSELYTVYWQYVEKAKEYVRTRGKSHFGEGSETNAVALMMKKYGIVPKDSYTGMNPGRQYHDHDLMFKEMETYLQNLKQNNAWNEVEIIATIKSIMHHYIGEPPTMVELNGKKITPLEYLNKVAKLNPDDYVDFMSLLEKPYWKQVEYDVPDNWWNSEEYYNLPIDDFMSIIKKAAKEGYSLSIGGDVTESGINSTLGVAMIPSYDIPSDYIDEHARQFRFSNGTTQDDHAIHLIGYLEKPNGTWFLIKDSGSSGHNNKNNPGYYYYHEDYVKLKMITLTIHKDAVKDILPKFN